MIISLFYAIFISQNSNFPRIPGIDKPEYEPIFGQMERSDWPTVDQSDDVIGFGHFTGNGVTLEPRGQIEIIIYLDNSHDFQHYGKISKKYKKIFDVIRECQFVHFLVKIVKNDRNRGRHFYVIFPFFASES